MENKLMIYENDAFGKVRTTFDTYIEVSQNKGGAYRRIGVKLTFVDAL